MWNNNNVKQLKTFWESGQTGTSIFTFFAAQNGPKIGHLRPILYTSVKVALMSINARMMEIQRKILNKIFENLNFYSFWRSKNLGLWGLSFTHLQKNLQQTCKSSFKWIQQKLFKKIDENIYIDLFWPYLGPKRAQKFSPHGPFLHTNGNTHNMHVNQVSWSHIKNFLRKWPKPKVKIH